jgi:hypothetical protein
MRILVELNESDLLARMRNFEDHLVERKTVKDEKDWKKTAVAFANSVPVGLPAVLYVGVRNNGEIETPQQNLDEVQKKFNTQMEKVYPRIAYIPKVIGDNGRQALAVIIPGSDLRPHFAGLSYVRKGSESIEASEEQFSNLLLQRQSKGRELLRWLNKEVTVHWKRQRTIEDEMYVLRLGTEQATLILVNLYWVTFRVHVQLEISDSTRDIEATEPLEKVLLSWDDSFARLKIEIVG